MAIGDTNRLLSEFRRNGYITQFTLDTGGNATWNIINPRERYNRATRLNEPGNEIIGKVRPIGINFVGLYFGRPVYYSVNNNLYDTAEHARTREIAASTRRTIVRNEDRRYVVRAGDTLADIAAFFYNGDVSKWRGLADLNNLDERTGLINPGNVLSIPRSL